MPDLKAIRERILSDDNFVLAEAERVLYLYTLKHTIRYGQTRKDTDYTESVAEHIYGMHIITDYFLPLEFETNKIDRERLTLLITWHDLGEIATGDIPNVRKTAADRVREAALLPSVIAKIPTHMQAKVASILEEYEDQITPESQFAKAIDKIEPLIHSFHPLGKGTQQQLKLTAESSLAAKAPYIKKYPTIQRFSNVLHTHMEKEGYFYQDC